MTFVNKAKTIAFFTLILACQGKDKVRPKPEPSTSPVSSTLPGVIEFEVEIIPPDPEPIKVLAKCSTMFDVPESNRSHNIRTAAAALNEVVIDPGEEFSFNDVVGPRTISKGYKTSIQFFDGEKVPGVGGGVCQVSSTLYQCLRVGALKVTTRQAHSRPVDYTPPGTDATVSWGELDLKFINTYDSPIKISTSVVDNRLSMTITGAETDLDVRHIYSVAKVLDFETRRIPVEGITKDLRVQRGKFGRPGISRWVYSDETGVVRTDVVYDRYQPIPEIWHVSAAGGQSNN